MNCISLSPPYGTLIALLLKRLETRGWSTSFRGQLAIHQTAAPGPKGMTEAALWDRCLSEPFRSALASKGIMSPARLPRGKIVAVVELRDCVHTQYLADAGRCTSVSWESGERTIWTLTDQERAFGDYSAGRYAWLLANVQPLETPIAARGMPGLWAWNGALDAGRTPVRD